MKIKNLHGLKYPDDYFIKFFFKNSLHLSNDLSFLELGCSNGNNLMLCYEYEHNVIGVDLDESLINYAKSNFNLLNGSGDFVFKNADMRNFCSMNKDLNVDVLVLANSIYYITKDEFNNLLINIKKNRIVKSGALIFLRFRDIDDYRFGNGNKFDDNAFTLDTSDEKGIFCQFYGANEMINILTKELDLRSFRIFNIKYQNLINNQKVDNSDVVLWGVVN